ncbi:MAG: hypothetical protein JRN16_02180 [Nitrososphaerota archaeon]|nr:hypothetical protein [Nitrososphaerota archaeon]MDG7010376.1 hypothetical protein [Nitrososphaerota archaeon]MDG7020027.1 hypothetical protein [Nitrososphaerota archaeon]MDG7027200.1 hypothetical protein [Nitrososphaerota archaeon]
MLKLAGSLKLPSLGAGGFDHADVHLQSGKVYIAHTADDNVEVVEGEALSHVATIHGCPEASGALCAQPDGPVFAAARGTGRLLVVDVDSDRTVKEVTVGSGPNDLTWDSLRKHLLVADVKDNQARLADPELGKVTPSSSLRGRPRWCLYDGKLDLFLVNIRDPPGVALISPETMAERKFVSVSVNGPHGLEAVEGTGRAFVACDGKALVSLDFVRGRETAKVPLSGVPDVLWRNRKRNILYCAGEEPGVIDVIDTENMTVGQGLATEEGAHTLAFDEKRQMLFVPQPKSGALVAYSEV